MTADDHSDGPARKEIPRAVLEQDHVYAAVGHSRRRYLCCALFEKAEWSLTELATKTAALEQEVPEREIQQTQREQMYISLYHTHVPKLAEAGVLEFDENSETIRADRNIDHVLMILDAIAAGLDDS